MEGGRPGGKKRQKWGSIVQETLERSFLTSPFPSSGQEREGEVNFTTSLFRPPPPDTYYTPLPRNTHTPLLLAILGQGRVS